LRAGALLCAGLAFVPAAMAQVEPAESLYIGGAYGEAKVDDRANAWKVFLGGRFDERFGGELAFLQTRDFPRAGSEPLKMRAVNFSVHAGIPLPRNSYLFGKAGVLRGHAQIGEAFEDDWGPSYGAGAMIGLSRRLALRIDWDRYRFDTPFSGHVNLDLVTVGAQYQFGK
jgi:hypothetical protein